MTCRQLCRCFCLWPGMEATQFPSKQVGGFSLQLEGTPRVSLSEFPLTSRLSLASGSASFSTKVNSGQIGSAVDGESWLLWENGHWGGREAGSEEWPSRLGVMCEKKGQRKAERWPHPGLPFSCLSSPGGYILQLLSCSGRRGHLDTCTGKWPHVAGPCSKGWPLLQFLCFTLRQTRERSNTGALRQCQGRGWGAGTEVCEQTLSCWVQGPRCPGRDTFNSFPPSHP